MLRTKSLISIGLLALTVGVWGLLGWRLLLAGGVVQGSLSSSWHGLARRSAWAHWVNGSPMIRDGVAYLQPGQQFEIAVQPISVCPYLKIQTDPMGRVTILSKDRLNAVATDRGFTTNNLPRTFDGYHFLIATETAVDLKTFQFTCRP